MPRSTSRVVAPRRVARLHPAARHPGATRFAPERLEPRALLAAVAWDGEGGDGDWHNPLNWIGDVLPVAGDDVTIAADPMPGATPDPTIAAGQAVTIASLDLGRALTIAGVLDVTESTHIRGIGFTVLEGAEVTTANLTIEHLAGGSEVSGTWTITGVSLIERLLRADGTITLGEGSETRLGVPGQSLGEINGIGAVHVGDRAVLTGVRDEPFGQFDGSALYAGHLTLGALATVSDLLIVMSGQPSDPARLECSTTLVTVFFDCSFILEDTVVSGNLDASGTALSVSGRVSFTGVARFDRSEVVIGSMGGGVLGTVWPGESERGRLEFHRSEIALGDETGSGPSSRSSLGGGGDLLLSGSDLHLASDATIGDATLISCTISGTGELAVEADVALRLEGTTLGASVRLVGSSLGAIILEGTGTNVIRGEIQIQGDDSFSPGMLEWNAGHVVLEGPDAQIMIGRHAVFTITALNASPGAPEMSGQGRLEVDPRGRIVASVANATISAGVNLQGSFRQIGGNVRLTGEITQLVTQDAANRPQTPWGFGLAQSTHLASGFWHVESRGTLSFGRRVDWNSARLVLVEHSAIADLGHKAIGGQLYNDGSIILRGQSHRGLLGTDYSTRIANAGLIAAEDDAIWTLLGDLSNTSGGNLRVEGDSRLRLRAKGVTNAGSVTLNASQGEPRLIVTGRYAQESGGRLYMAAGYDNRLFLPTLRVGGVMTLGGTLRLQLASPVPAGAWPADWVAGESAKRRAGVFNRVVLDIVPRTGNLAYTADAFSVMTTA